MKIKMSGYSRLLFLPILAIVYQNCSVNSAFQANSADQINTNGGLAESLVFSATSASSGGLSLQQGESIRSGAVTLTMGNDGNLVLHDGGNKPLWTSGTNGCSRCLAVFQQDGNFVIYDQASSPSKVIFNTSTAGRGKDIRFSNVPPYLSIVDSNNRLLWMAVSPTLEDLFNGKARFQSISESQEVSLKFTSSVKGVWDQKLPMFKKPGDDSFYAFTRGYLGNDKFNIFLMKSTDGVNFTQVGNDPVFKSLTSEWTVYDPHLAVDTSVQPHRYVMSMECGKYGSFGASVCTSVSTTPWIADSWSMPQLVVANSGLRSASTGTTLFDQGNAYIKWTLVNDERIMGRPSSESTSSWAHQVSNISAFFGKSDEGRIILGAEENTHCTSSWDCNNTDVQDWKKIGNYYYAIYNGANYFRCVREAGDSGTSNWGLAIRRSTHAMGPYTESTGPFIMAERMDICGTSYPMLNQIGNLNYLYYAYYPKGGGNRTMRSLLVWGQGSKSVQAPLPQSPNFGQAPVTCSSFSYSAWGTCQSDNKQYRTVISSSPLGCAGGSPVLSQSCATDPNVAVVTKAYQVYLARAPDAAGLNYFVSFMKTNNRTALGLALFDSGEFQKSVPSENSAYVAFLYQRLLNRQPEAIGLNTWTSSLNSGVETRRSVFLGFINAAEFKKLHPLIAP